MLELPGGFAIIADERQYIVGNPYLERTRGGKERERIKNPRYFETLSGAVKDAAARAMREKVRTDEITNLKDFISEYQKVIAEIKELTEPLNV